MKNILLCVLADSIVVIYEKDHDDVMICYTRQYIDALLLVDSRTPYAQTCNNMSYRTGAFVIDVEIFYRDRHDCFVNKNNTISINAISIAAYGLTA